MAIYAHVLSVFLWELVYEELLLVFTALAHQIIADIIVVKLLYHQILPATSYLGKPLLDSLLTHYLGVTPKTSYNIFEDAKAADNNYKSSVVMLLSADALQKKHVGCRTEILLCLVSHFWVLDHNLFLLASYSWCQICTQYLRIIHNSWN